ncbi:MAG: alcohol dehydrogenase catalytic domain-containing protein, partial [Geminicoccaceae bacterium]
MKAVVSKRYGSPDVLEIVEVPKPKPKADEVLIEVHATTVTRTDDGLLRPHPFFIRLSTGLLRPKCTTLGMDFAGTVEAVGPDVTSFQPGERVFGMSPSVFGAHAEYLCLPEHGQIATMPTGARFDEVVLCEGAWYAYTCLNKLGLKPDHKILIYGAS